MQRVPPETTDAARRQLTIDRYVVDFACRSARIAIELDGGQHGLRIEEDAARTAHLGRHGWTVLRFWNNEVRDHLEGVVGTIMLAVARASTHPQPLPCREGS